jgi:NNP family nitrate/nitrite transporter-like MFS transporter
MTAVLDQLEAAPQRARRGRWIDDWNPEDETFWRTRGRRIAWRNLAFSVLAEHLAFNVWLLMSVVVVRLNDVGFAFSVGQKFLLVIVPNLVSALLRIPYTFAFPRFGGRAWTALSAIVLLIPCGMLLYAVTSGAPYWFFLLTAAVLGLGGATFSSSNANISYFFPERHKGLALGLNAAGGNIGAAVAQLVVPVAISIGGGIHLAYAAVMWMPCVVVAAACAWWFMDSLTDARPDGSSMRAAMSNRHTWVVSSIYVGTFGSFIGFSFAFPMLIDLSFPEYSDYLGLAFLGALISASVRPVGGWLADRVGGARVTLCVFGGMALGASCALVSVSRHDFGLFFGSFLAMFVLTGLGNGSTYRMIPLIFSAQAREKALRTGASLDAVQRSAKRQSAAVVGITGAFGAFGGVLVNVTFNFSLSGGGSLAPALIAFIGLYAVCATTTWWFYLRKRFAVDRAPSLAYANV